MRSWFWALIAIVALILSVVALVEFNLLQPRLSSIQETVNSNQETLKGLSEKVATVPENVTELGARIDSLEKAQGELAQELSAQKSFMDELSSVVSKNKNLISELSQNLGAFMSSEEIQHYFEKQNQKVSTLESTLSSLSQKVDEINAFSSALSRRFEVLEESLTQVSSQLRKEFQEKINLLYRSLQDTTQNLDAFQSQLEEFRA
ncbi:MAG: hypothetical protein J7J32_06595, partial [Candidatus Atribacteria bacterium]|nr:hypothetical protein [Candidatus Atribacteria bacterium]MCD6350324.1 hypothetical protein [Candidatus Atribacteria bacterium]